MSDSKYIESPTGSKSSTKLEDRIARTIEWAICEDSSSIYIIALNQFKVPYFKIVFSATI